MNRILKIGMDVHSTNYTLCVVEPKLEGDPELLYEVQVEPDYLNILKVISNLKKKYKSVTGKLAPLLLRLRLLKYYSI
jgi:hypothetical protein